MFGTNPIRPPVKGDGQTLDVQEVFPTLQGEGPLVGMPAVFVRLGGCNLACTFCDTEFESFHALPLPALLAQIAVQACNAAGTRVRHLVVITGGEPLRQPITPLCTALLAEGFAVQLETNGTLWRTDLPAAVQVVCSPKPGAHGYTLRPDVLARAAALKFIIAADDPLYADVPPLPPMADGAPVPAIFVQPMDTPDAARTQANLQRALSLAQEHGYRLSLQTHKLLAIP